jgi:hypothetical protein
LRLLARFDLLVAVETLERAADVALVAAGGFVLLLLELGVFDEDLAVFAPVLRLQFRKSKRRASFI